MHITYMILIGLVVAQVSFAADPTVLISPKKIVPGGFMIVTVQSSTGTVEGVFRGRRLLQ